MAQKNGVGVDALSAVHEITAKIVASLDLDQTLATIARAMCEVISADIVRCDGGLLVRGDVQTDEPELAVAGVGVSPLQDRVALAERFDLATGEREPRLDALEQLVLVSRAAVLGDELLSGFSGHGRPILGFYAFGTVPSHTRALFRATLAAGGGWT